VNGANGSCVVGDGGVIVEARDLVFSFGETPALDGREDLIGQQIEDALDPDSSTPPYRRFTSRNFSNLYSGCTTWC
jgi:hypothetical protein